jgi:hypothetical protein
MSTKWGRQRKAATEAGALHADGGPDRRAEFASRGSDVRDAYDSGYQNRRQEMARQADAFDHPLRQISRDANALWTRADSSEVSELARLIEGLADYLVEKEERDG